MAWLKKVYSNSEEPSPSRLLNRYYAQGMVMLPELIKFVSHYYRIPYAEAQELTTKETLPLKVVQDFMRHTEMTNQKLMEPSLSQQDRLKITDAWLSQNKTSKRRKAYILLGLPGSGKSTYANLERLLEDNLEIDVDLFKPYVPTFSQGYGAALSHQDSRLMGDITLEKASVKGENLILPLVGSDPRYVVGAIQKLKAMGYEVHVKLITIPKDEAIARIENRYNAQKRYVPLEYIEQVADAPERTFEELRKLGDAKSFESVDALEIAKMRPSTGRPSVQDINKKNVEDKILVAFNKQTEHVPLNMHEEWEKTVFDALTRAEKIYKLRQELKEKYINKIRQEEEEGQK